MKQRASIYEKKEKQKPKGGKRGESRHNELPQG